MNLQQELEPGTILQGKYNITKGLGHGGFGITYKAENLALGNTVCIKELFIGGNSTRGVNNTVQSQGVKDASFDYFKQRFIEEARGLAKFNHPGIVRVTDVFEENNTAYFVMEFATGQTLKDLVSKQGALPSGKAIALILHLLDAVEAVHSQGMLHRDIKPDNIIVTPEGKSVLIDFGSARQFAEGYTTTQTAILTPGYAPLEQYSDKAKRGPYTDIYALGATIYYVLTGVKPIAATDRTLEEIPSPETLNTSVSKTLASVVMLAMNLKPEDRFQTIAEMREALNSQRQNKTQETTILQAKVKEVRKKRVEKPMVEPVIKVVNEAEEARKGNNLFKIVLGVVVLIGLIVSVMKRSNNSDFQGSVTETYSQDSVASAPSASAKPDYATDAPPSKEEAPANILTMEQVSNLINDYYADMNNQNFNAFTYFSENVDQYISLNNVTPTDINNAFSSSDYTNSKSVIHQNSIAYEENINGLSFWNYWINFSCYRPSLEKYQDCNVKIRIGVDENKLIHSYTEVKVSDLVFHY